MQAAIIGCGLIGEKRLRSMPPGTVKVLCDLDPIRALRLASLVPEANVMANWREAVSAPDIDAVFVATTNRWLAPISRAAAEAGRHVLVEKPGAISVRELDTVVAAAEHRGVIAQVGFNHRFHPGLERARQLVEDDMIGDLMFVRGRYGHGGRVGYDREWRADPQESGGGELMDQGVHLIDLSRWFLGEFSEVDGFTATYFWDMRVDDNAFLTLRTPSGRCAFLHVSCTEWKNLFSLEIYGRTGKIHVEGLGGSYGLEKVAFYKMSQRMGPPETIVWEYPGPDLSWAKEFDAFADSIDKGQIGGPGLRDARAALQIVETVYAKGAKN